MIDMIHMDYINAVTADDLDELKRKEATYKGSWKKRGGIGAAMMILRKVDRLENMLEERAYDIFDKIDMSGADGTMLAEIRDLRRYLILVEAELQARHGPKPVPLTEENHYAERRPGRI